MREELHWVQEHPKRQERSTSKQVDDSEKSKNVEEKTGVFFYPLEALELVWLSQAEGFPGDLTSKWHRLLNLVGEILCIPKNQGKFLFKALLFFALSIHLENELFWIKINDLPRNIAILISVILNLYRVN